ncbi:MAG: hypothetical protein J6L81_07355 [Clostridia bacterium]|nr:hypothetical protein [Clostridia bacterium]
MAQETIDRIREAEEKANSIINDAKARAQQIIEDSKTLSQSQYDEAVAAAKKAADITIDASREENIRLLTDEGSKSADECERLKKSVEPRLGAATDAVIAEILGGKEG